MNPRPPQSAGYFGHTSFFDRNSPLNLENLPNSLLQKLKRLKDDKNVLTKVKHIIISKYHEDRETFDNFENLEFS